MARVPYTDPEDLPEEYRELVVSSLQPGKTVNVYRAIGNNPEVLDGFRTFLGSLWSESGLSDRQRELVILATARRADSSYEWHQHVGIAQNAGVTDDEIRAISAGDYSGFDAAETALLDYTNAVVDGAVTDGLSEALAEHFDHHAVSGATSTAAGYLALASVIDALGVEIETGDEFIGWDLEHA